MLTKIIKIISVLFFFLLAACAPHPRAASELPVDDEAKAVEAKPVAEQERETAKVSSWEISGAMAAKSKNKAWSASLNWLQRGINNYQMRLFGPLGSGTVIIEKKGGTVTYRDGPKTASSRNASELLLKQTGIRLPVNNLYYWVRGLPAPGSVQGEKRDQYNHLSQLKQGGYVINYARYTSVKGKDLPSKIYLQGHGLSIKLVIRSWKI